MSEPVLSQSEVEDLFSVLEGQGGGKRPAGGGTSPRVKVTPYDFKRPERVGQEQMRALQSLHEGFGRNFGAALSGLLRTIVEVKLTSVDQLTYSEFVYSLENPTCFNVIEAKPLEGNLILDLNPVILYPIIDRLLGGGKELGTVSRRPLTEIEKRLVGKITELFLRELAAAWENILPLELRVEKVESNPQLVQIVPPNEVVVLVSFELAIDDLRGMINLCIPFNAIERHGHKLADNSWFTYGRVESNAETARLIRRGLGNARVGLSVTLAETTITTRELLDLRVGDIITTNHDVQQPLEVVVQGAAKFLARPGALKGRTAIQIESVLAPPAAEEKPKK